MLFTRGASPPWDPTHVSDVSRLAVRFLTASATWEARYPTQMRALFSTRPGPQSLPSQSGAFPVLPHRRCPALQGEGPPGPASLSSWENFPSLRCFYSKYHGTRKFGFNPGLMAECKWLTSLSNCWLGGKTERARAIHWYSQSPAPVKSSKHKQCW